MDSFVLYYCQEAMFEVFYDLDMDNNRLKIEKLSIKLSLILIGTFFYFFANFQRIAIPGTIFDILGQELSVTAPYITAFGAIFMYIYALQQLINGVLVDRFGGYRIMLTGGIILTTGALLFPISSCLIVMYIARGLVGLGSSMFYLSIIKELRDVVPEKDFGIAISIMLFIGYTGGILANAPFVFAMKYAGWRDILITFTSLTIIALIAFIILLKKVKLNKVSKNIKLRALPFKLVLHKKHNRNLFSFACCNYAITYTIQTVIGMKFLQDFCNMTVAKSAMVLTGMAIIGAVFNIINAYICKITHNHRVKFLKNASIITFCSILLIVLVLIFDIKTYFISCIFFILAANASLSSILVPVLHLTNKKMVSGTAVSLMNFCFFTMVGVLGTLTGFLLNIFDPIKKGELIIYTNDSYLLVFGLFLIISLFEMHKAMKLSNRY